jgi:hypothetical protein
MGIVSLPPGIELDAQEVELDLVTSDARLVAREPCLGDCVQEK